MPNVCRLVSLLVFAVPALYAQDFRLTAPERAVQMRVQVLYAGGTALYDSDWKNGNVFDVNALPFGSYELRILSRDLEGRVVERQTTLNVAAERITIDPALPEDLKLTTTAHDGTIGQIITTSGDLSFRFGDYLNKKDTEAMRLSPEGNLEVKGWIKAGQGIMFSDGSTVDTKKKLKAKSDATGTGTQNKISKWIDSAGTLGDSAMSEVSGNVGIGTITPTGKLHIFGAANQDLFAGMGVDMIAGPAFNFGYGGATFGRSAGFFNVRPDGSAVAPNPSLRFMTANVERMIVTNAGNVGIGTSTPGGKLQIFAAPAADVFAGIGTDMNAGPSMNFGYGGASFGRGAGFFNAKPDASAVAPNPSLRFMTNNLERMIVTNAGNVGIGTSAPTQKMEINGNLALPATASAAAGVIYIDAAPFIHSYGVNNTFVGSDAGNFTMDGFNNTGIGKGALTNNSSGNNNTATGRTALTSNTDGVNNTGIGMNALLQNTTGNSNTAAGCQALQSNTTGTQNTASGHGALFGNTTGSNSTAIGFNALASSTGGGNTAIGSNALVANTTGFGNIALGQSAGENLTTGINNIEIGNFGVAADSSTTRIGSVQTRAFIAGIRSVTTDAADAVAVVIDSNGQLGTTSSSRRFKFDIADMAGFSDRLLQLRPVTFRYSKYGDNGPLQAGLIAEEVAKIYPELVTRDKDGQPETVMYQFLAPMLLNEVQKERTTITALEQRLEVLEGELAELKAKR